MKNQLTLFLSVALIVVSTVLSTDLSPPNNIIDRGEPVWLMEIRDYDPNEQKLLDEYLSERSKKSAAFGRAHFRPGKRDMLISNPLFFNDQTQKPSAGTAKANFRSAKRSVFNSDFGGYYRQYDKRLIGTGRTNFRPGKRSLMNPMFENDEMHM